MTTVHESTAPSTCAAAQDSEPREKQGVLGAIGSAITFGIGYSVFNAVPSEILAHLVGGAIAGLVVGLLPFFVAKHRGNHSLAAWSLGACAVSGVIGGLLLGVPVAIVSLIVILMKKGHASVQTVVS